VYTDQIVFSVPKKSLKILPPNDPCSASNKGTNGFAGPILIDGLLAVAVVVAFIVDSITY